MTPAIIFNTNHKYVMEIFCHLIDSLSNEEIEKHPYYYTIMEDLNHYYQAYKTKRKTYEDNIKLTSQNKDIEKYDKMKRFDDKELESYRIKITEIHNKYITRIEKSSIDEVLKKQQLDKINRSYQQMVRKEFIEDLDIFEKHPDYSFTRVSMKSHTIRELRKNIEKKLDIKIKYENYLIQGLKRGVGIYSKNLPDVYLCIVQELAQNKELGIIVSDDSLALGINMPLKTVVIAGWKQTKTIDKLLYHQMIGRAGRRGLDTEGNVVYANIDWKSHILSQMSDISGIPPIKSISQLGKIINPRLDWDKTDKDHLYHLTHPNTTSQSSIVPDEESINRIIWKLRKHHTPELLNMFNYIEMLYKGNELGQSIIDKVFRGLIKIIFEGKPFDPEHWYEKDIDNLTYEKLYLYLSSKQVQEFDENDRILENIVIIGNICKFYYNHYHLDSCLNPILLECFIICKTLRFKYYHLLNH